METSKVKQLNVNLVKAILKTMPGKTKFDIAMATGLSQATCNTILNELVSTGEVLELEQEAFGGGRPAKRFMYNGDYGMVICLYLDNDSNKPVVSYAVVNLLGVVKEELTIRKESVDYNTIEDLIGELIAKYNNVKAAAIGIPGIVIQRQIIDICDIKSLVNCPMAEKLQDKFGKKVSLENDMNLTSLGYYQQHGYTKDTSVVVINFLNDNCPGSGIIIDGKIISGYTNFAGEISYLPFGSNTPTLRNPQEVIERVVATICSITAIINPETIMVTGGLITEDMIEEIRSSCIKIIPERHMPNIVYRRNIHDYYIKGLTAMAFESLLDPLTTINKKFNNTKELLWLHT
ncbi:MAG: ROK family protein [Acetivibrionales bacterium]|jgi:predicted NBD/HSP70 family sugar kinase